MLPTWSAILMFVIMAVATDTRAVASMNPMRSLGPALVSGDLHALWVYIVAPVVGTSVGALLYVFGRGKAVRPAEPGAQHQSLSRGRLPDSDTSE